MLQAIELHNNEVGQISADKMRFLLHDNDSDDEVMLITRVYCCHQGEVIRIISTERILFAISQQGANIKERAANNQKKTQSNKSKLV